MHAIVTLIARIFIVLPALISAWVWWQLPGRDKKRLLVCGVIAAGVAILSAKLASSLVTSPRPFIADHIQAYFVSARDNGFPSDHTLLAATIGFVVLIFHRRWGVVCLVLAVLIGVARVIAGVHHGIDIVGGMLLGGLATAIAYGGLRLIERLRRSRSDSAL